MVVPSYPDRACNSQRSVLWLNSPVGFLWSPFLSQLSLYYCRRVSFIRCRTQRKALSPKADPLGASLRIAEATKDRGLAELFRHWFLTVTQSLEAVFDGCVRPFPLQSCMNTKLRINMKWPSRCAPKQTSVLGWSFLYLSGATLKRTHKLLWSQWSERAKWKKKRKDTGPETGSVMMPWVSRVQHMRLAKTYNNLTWT